MKKLLIIGVIFWVMILSSIAVAEKSLWSYETNGAVLAVEATGDTVAVGSKGGVVSVFGMNGALKWKYKTSGDVGSISIFGDTMAVGSADSLIYVFDKNTGNLRWTSGAGEIPKVAVSENTVAVGTYDNKLYVFDLEGRLRWNVTGSDEIKNIFSIAISKDLLIVATGDIENAPKIGDVHAFNINTGSEKWRQPIDGWAFTMAVSDDTIVAGSWKEKMGNGEVYAFDREGNVKWKFSGSEEVSSVAVSGDAVAFGELGYDEGKVHLLDKDTGKVRWTEYVREPFMDMQSMFSMQWIALTEDSVVVGSRDNKVHVYEKSTGCERWSYKTNEDVHTVAVADGKIVAGSTDMSVYVFNEGEIGSAPWCKKQMGEETLKIIEIIGIAVAVLGIIFLFLLFTGRIK
jgi:outer membrane protein assembly factor BamB